LIANIENSFILLPICIFILRIADVSIGTTKLLFIVRGYRLVAAVLAFMEVSIWLCATALVFQHLDNFWNTFAFAAGFAGGTAVGMTLEQWIGIGHVLIRVFTKYPTEELRKELKVRQFGATSIQGTGHNGELSVILVLTTSKKAKELRQLICNRDAEAVITVDTVRSVFGGFGLSHPLAASVRK
jgi:uncharacterized protein YebE (UPF0316 family)